MEVVRGMRKGKSKAKCWHRCQTARSFSPQRCGAIFLGSYVRLSAVNLQGIKVVAEVGQERKRHTRQKVKGSNMGGAETWAKIGQKMGKIGGTTLRGKCLLHEQEVAGSNPAPPTNFILALPSLVEPSTQKGCLSCWQEQRLGRRKTFGGERR